MGYTIYTFIDYIKGWAKANMKATQVLASLTIAQAILESGYGNSHLAQNANNLFGMKGEYNNQFVRVDTIEYKSGKPYTVEAKFRKYPSWKESIDDHADIFRRSDRYKAVIGEEDYAESCRKIQAAGYATNDDYADELIKIIQKYKLYEYDQVGEESEEDVLTTTTIQLNGKIKEVERILKNGSNYIKLRDLVDEYIEVDYDKEKKLPIIQIQNK